MTHFVRNNESIRMEGKNPLCGTVHIQGSKNAALPIMAACILIPGKCVLRNCPDITDIEYMCNLIKSTGAVVRTENARKQTGLSIEINKKITKFSLNFSFPTNSRLPELCYEYMKEHKIYNY